MIIWSGLGIFVPLFVIACEVGMYQITTAIFHDGDYWDMHGWAKGGGLIIAGVVCWFLGHALARSGAQTLIDQATGQTVVLRRSHSFFFIPMHWWGIALVLGGLRLSFISKTREELQQSRIQHAAEQAIRDMERAERPAKQK